MKRLHEDISSMRDDKRKIERKLQLERYEESILNGAGEFKASRASEAALAMTCPPLRINGVTLPRFQRAIGECPKRNDGYEPNAYELKCDNLIKYVLYSPVHRCTLHGESYLEEAAIDGGRKRYRCIKCDAMTEDKKMEKRKTKKSTNIGTKKFETMFTTTTYL